MMGADSILCPLVCDHDMYKETVRFVSEMFEREVFDYAVIPCSAGRVFSSAGLAAINRDPVLYGKGKFIGKDGPLNDFKGKRFVIVGDALTTGMVEKEIVGAVTGNGGQVIKLGYVTEDGTINARKTVLKGIPVESMKKF